MRDEGWVPMRLEPGVWMLHDSGVVIAVAFVHMDDFVIGVSHHSKQAMRKFDELQNYWRWSSWESGSFRQAGLDVAQLADFTVKQSFVAAAAQVEKIEGWSRQADQTVDCQQRVLPRVGQPLEDYNVWFHRA